MSNTPAAERLRSCRDVITDALDRNAGLVRVSIDKTRKVIQVEYDPRKVAVEDVERAADSMKPDLAHLKVCPLWAMAADTHFCQACMRTGAGRDRGRTALDPSRSYNASSAASGDATLEGGVLRVFIPERLETGTEDVLSRLHRLEVSFNRSTETAAPRKGLIDSIRRQNWEAIFTAVTFVAMFLGLAAERLFHAPVLRVVAYALAFLTGGAYGTIGGVRSLLKRVIDIDMLMILAALGAAVVGSPFEGALLLFLFSFSNVLQDFALDRTRNAIRALMKLRPDTAVVIRDAGALTMRVEDIAVGERFVVRPGDRIALDGKVVEGESSVDQSAITGESRPVPKEPGSDVLAGTINRNGSLTISVTKKASESTLTKIIRLVEDAQQKKAKTERFLDRFEQGYAVVVILGTIVAAVVPIVVLGQAFGPAFYRAITLMVAASPCALIISTPASVLSAIGNGARRGLLFKGGVFVEKGSAIRVVALDKTGTLTHGRPAVTDIEVFTAEQTAEPDHWAGDRDALLGLAAAVESRSEHVLAQATVAAAGRSGLPLSETLAFEATSGRGVRARIEGRTYQVGNMRFLDGLEAEHRDDAVRAIRLLEEEGKTAVVVAQILGDRDARVLGVIGFMDTVRDSARDVVRELKVLGMQRVVMLTGDNRAVAERIGAEVGVDEVHAELLPDQKLDIIRDLEKRYGPVAMVGDGVNDAPALAAATIGVAMGAAGSDVALETADVVLLSDDLRNVPYIIQLSRRTIRTLVTNLGVAIGLILAMIAAIFLVNLPLPLAVVGHEGGTVLVSLNGLRLLIHRKRRDRRVGGARVP